METRVILLIRSFHRTLQNDPDDIEKHNRSAVTAAHLTLCMQISYRFSQIVTRILMFYPILL